LPKSLCLSFVQIQIGAGLDGSVTGTFNALTTASVPPSATHPR
jgi:hypothetical protein